MFIINHFNRTFIIHKDWLKINVLVLLKSLNENYYTKHFPTAKYKYTQKNKNLALINIVNNYG